MNEQIEINESEYKKSQLKGDTIIDIYGQKFLIVGQLIFRVRPDDDGQKE